MLVTSLAGDDRSYTFLLQPQATGQGPQPDYTTAPGQSQHAPQTCALNHQFYYGAGPRRAARSVCSRTNTSSEARMRSTATGWAACRPKPSNLSKTKIGIILGL